MDMNMEQAKILGRMFVTSGEPSKPMAIVVEPGISPEEAERIANIRDACISARLPVYHSFESIARAINVVETYNEKYPGRLS